MLREKAKSVGMADELIPETPWDKVCSPGSASAPDRAGHCDSNEPLWLE